MMAGVRQGLVANLFWGVDLHPKSIVGIESAGVSWTNRGWDKCHFFREVELRGSVREFERGTKRRREVQCIRPH